LDDKPAPELTARFLLVGAQAPDEVRFGVHQRPFEREKIKIIETKLLKFYPFSLIKKKINSSYREIQMGAVAKSYYEEGLPNI
jgi:hypothetical protein